MELLDLKPSDTLTDPPVLDDLLICGACGSLSKVTLLGTTLATDEDINTLTDEERADLSFGQRAVKRQLRNN